MKTSLYRYYDEADTLLYVGASHNPFSREMQHEASDKDMTLVRHIEIEWFDTRQLAESAEAIAIRREKPLWNKVTPKRALRLSPTYLGRHFGYAPQGAVAKFSGVDHWFDSDASPFHRALKICRAGDVIHVHHSIELSKDDVSKCVQNCVHLWRHHDEDFE